MDPAGAAALRLRIEQQEHWRLAASVRDGRQAHIDPDLHVLRELRDNERVYQDDVDSFVKRLIGGDWARVEIA